MPLTNIVQNQSPVGTIKSSMLTLAQFQAQNGTGWVLADGGSCVGSSYATLTGFTTVPDARGLTLRGKNNGRSDGNQNPDGDSTLGTYQADGIGSHNHGTYSSPNNWMTNGGNNNQGVIYVNNNGTIQNNAGAANETRMKNITVNWFIRIN